LSSSPSAQGGTAAPPMATARVRNVRRWGWGIYAALLALAAAAAMIAEGRNAPVSLDASVDNSGPAGIRALYLYLKEQGHEVRREDDGLEEIQEGTRTLVLPSPIARHLSTGELASVQEFVRRGGTLVYLAPRPIAKAQPETDEWLALRTGEWIDPRPLALSDQRGDLGGASVEAWFPGGAEQGVRQLRVSASRALEGEDPDALPIAGIKRATYGLWKAFERGEVWTFAGGDLAENRRIELLDNIRLWELLASRGPMLFDESHHRRREALPRLVSGGLIAFCVQFLACAAFFAYAQGSRLGPPRPVQVERHRAAIEYLSSLAWLTRSAKVEKELLAELGGRFRIALQERFGISPSLPEEEAAQALQEICRIPRQQFLQLYGQLRAAMSSRAVSPGEYARLAKQFAQLEGQIAGRGQPRAPRSGTFG